MLIEYHFVKSGPSPKTSLCSADIFLNIHVLILYSVWFHLIDIWLTVWFYLIDIWLTVWFYLIDMTDLSFLPSSLVWPDVMNQYDLVRPDLTGLVRPDLTGLGKPGLTRFYLVWSIWPDLFDLIWPHWVELVWPFLILIFYSTIQLVTRFCRWLLRKFFSGGSKFLPSYFFLTWIRVILLYLYQYFVFYVKLK